MSSRLEAALDAAKERRDQADKAWASIASDVANGSPEVREELQSALAEAADDRRNAFQAVADLQSEYVAETLLERYGDDQEAAICEGKSPSEAVEIADLNLYSRMTGHEHMGERESLREDVASEMSSRFGEEKAEAYEQQRGGHPQEQVVEQDQSIDSGIER